ncbi:MAG: PQQ-binding-like beta-propeller repeat protein [Hamadaea sp.]|nr:PQQ-binding-like beta-propeller repeat protein [Hamadaea sp.]
MIDLGEIGPETFEPPTPPPGRWRWTARGVVGVLAIVLGGGVAGAAPPAWMPPVFRISPLLEGPLPAPVFGDALMDVDVDRGTLRAVELNGGGVRWQVDLPAGVWPEMIALGDAVMVSMIDMPVDAAPYAAADVHPLGTRAFDLATGAELWRHDGSVAAPVRDGVVAVRGRGPWVAGVDTTTGTERWRHTWSGQIRSISTAYGTLDAAAPENRELTIAVADGTVQTLDLVTGRTLREVRVRPGRLEVYAWRDLIGVHYFNDVAAVEFAVYRAGSGERLWSRRLTGTSGNIWPCSMTTLCAQDDLVVPQHLDPSTGRPTQAPAQSAETAMFNVRDEVIGEIGGQPVLLVQPGDRRPGVWLSVGERGNSRPLLRIGEGLLFCSVQDQWLTCYDDQLPRSAYAVRVADLERLIAEVS